MLKQKAWLAVYMLQKLELQNYNFTPTMSISHLRTPSWTKTPTPTRISILTNVPTQCKTPTLTRRA